MQIHDMQKLFALNFEFAPMVLIYRQTCIKPHLYIYHIECIIYSYVVDFPYSRSRGDWETRVDLLIWMKVSVTQPFPLKRQRKKAI